MGPLADDRRSVAGPPPARRVKIGSSGRQRERRGNDARYKIYLGESLNSTFHEIGDFAGHGRDHCELVNPKFTIPNEDDITSGGCKDCEVKMGPWESRGSVPVYTRGRYGEPFKLQTWPKNNLYTSIWYECGVAIGQ